MLRRLPIVLLTLAGLTLASTTFSGEKDKKDDKKEEKKNPCIIPVPRDKGWVKRHEGFAEIAKKGGVNVLLLGDSITDAWRGGGAKKAWEKHFAQRGAANFGISGDRTEHVLWRIQNGELEPIDPKLVMLMIGTNNTGANSAPEIAEGIEAIVKHIRAKKPSTKILLLAVFPRDEKPGTDRRVKIDEINKTISKLDDGKMVKYLDIGSKFLAEGGILPRDVMPDLLHLSEKGYNIWGEAVEPTIQALLEEKK